MTRKDKTCPVCRALSKAETSPFCSERCRDVDLNRWLSGRYSISAADDDKISMDDDERTD